MAQRLTLRRRLPYSTASNKRKMYGVISSFLVFVWVKLTDEYFSLQCEDSWWSSGLHLSKETRFTCAMWWLQERSSWRMFDRLQHIPFQLYRSLCIFWCRRLSELVPGSFIPSLNAVSMSQERTVDPDVTLVFVYGEFVINQESSDVVLLCSSVRLTTFSLFFMRLFVLVFRVLRAFLIEEQKIVSRVMKVKSAGK